MQQRIDSLLAEITALLPSLHTFEQEEFLLSVLRLLPTFNSHIDFTPYLAELQGEPIFLQSTTTHNVFDNVHLEKGRMEKVDKTENILVVQKGERVKKRVLAQLIRDCHSVSTQLVDSLVKSYRYLFILRYGANWVRNFEQSRLYTIKQICDRLGRSLEGKKLGDLGQLSQNIKEAREELGRWLFFADGYTRDSFLERRWLHVSEIFKNSVYSH